MKSRGLLIGNIQVKKIRTRNWLGRQFNTEAARNEDDTPRPTGGRTTNHLVLVRIIILDLHNGLSFLCVCLGRIDRSTIAKGRGRNRERTS